MCISQAWRLPPPFYKLMFKIILASDGLDKRATQILKQVELGLATLKHVPERGIMTQL